MRGFFRWLWRYNAVVLAIVGTLVAIGLSTLVLTQLSYPRPRTAQAPVVVGDAAKSTLGDFRHIAGTHFAVAELATESKRRLAMSRSYGEDSAAVNVVFFDLNNGRGLRLFPQDGGRVVQKYFVDARCRSASTSGGETSSVAFVATYAERDTNGDGIVGYDDGAVLGLTLVSEIAWRPLVSGVTGMEHLTEMENGHCLALVRTGAQARAIEFDPTTGVAVRNVEPNLN